MAASQRLGVRSWWSQFSSSATRIKSAPPLFGNGTTHSKRLGGISSDGGLSRKLGLADLILLGIGASIGAGIFVVTGTVAHDAGPAVVVSFALAATACVPNALSYAELSSRFPALVGGAYMYSYSTFNELTAFLVFCHLMLDYHIGAASITRSLASYLVTSLQVSIVLMVIAVGSFEVDTSNWTPFTPNGLTPVITGATVVFFAYVGFDAVANSAEECKNPQRDLPIGILVSLFVCAGLYVAVCFVVTGMVPYINLGGDAPLANAFMDKGLNFVSILISVGAVCGLTTTVLVGLYVQSRLYLGLGRDGLLPAFFAKIDAHHQTPVTAQVWVGSVAAILAGFFNVSHLSHILSVGCLASYSIVCACVVMLRINTENQWQDGEDQLPQKGLTRWNEAVLCMLGISLCGFLVGLCYRTGGPVTYEIVLLVIMGLLLIPLLTRQEYRRPSGFACPWVPLLPVLSIGFNMFLFAQLHWEAWVRFGVVTAIAVLVYAFYGQYNATTNASSGEHSPLYHQASVEDLDT
uniref:Cationic amino acid transporter C-terminal domain-containing protein n=1 Tax=Physcomitrium patens TaxID=3218 RepID=A0A7I4AKY0_PHYPA